MRKNETQPGVELILSPSATVRERIGIDKAALDRIVQQKVAEIMAERDAVVFEPFFRSRQIAYELKRLQTVPEQEKWSVRFERYGCLLCQTKKQIHVGCGMCQNCYQRTFTELSRIIAEGMTGQPARPARGASKAERLLQENRPLDAPRRAFYQRSSKTDKLLYMRVAQQLGVDPDHVRRVALGLLHSDRVSAALKKESERLLE